MTTFIISQTRKSAEGRWEGRVGEGESGRINNSQFPIPNSQFPTVNCQLSTVNCKKNLP
ncbi:MAG: hypothetical protein HC786_30840 [Richelia sp. CSU_2_1]|nr:hypothetical protein [Richelia sp. CSU_2_1]